MSARGQKNLSITQNILQAVGRASCGPHSSLGLGAALDMLGQLVRDQGKPSSS